MENQIEKLYRQKVNEMNQNLNEAKNKFDERCIQLKQ